MNLPVWAVVVLSCVGPAGVGGAVTAWILGGRKQAEADNGKTRADTANINAQATKTTAETARVVAETNGQVAATADKIVESAGGVVHMIQEQLERQAQQIAANAEGLSRAEQRIGEYREFTTLLYHAVQQRDAALRRWADFGRTYQGWASLLTAALKNTGLNVPPPPRLPDLAPIEPDGEALEWAAFHEDHKRGS